MKFVFLNIAVLCLYIGFSYCAPIENVTIVPDANSTILPVEVKTDVPTIAPIEINTDAPIEVKTDVPTIAPIEINTDAPIEVNTDAPIEVNTDAPIENCTDVGTDAPIELITGAPTIVPIEVKTDAPTDAPIEVKTDAPTIAPIDDSSESTDSVVPTSSNSTDSDEDYTLDPNDSDEDHTIDPNDNNNREPVNTTNPEIIPFAIRAVAYWNTNNNTGTNWFHFVQIINGTKQAVAGIEYNLHIMIEETTCDKSIPIELSESSNCTALEKGKKYDVLAKIEYAPWEEKEDYEIESFDESK